MKKKSKSKFINIIKELLILLDEFISKVSDYISIRKKNKKLRRLLTDCDKEIADLRDTVSVISLELNNQKKINTRVTKERNNLQIEVNGLRGVKK